jgi:hypothetical protein
VRKGPPKRDEAPGRQLHQAERRFGGKAKATRLGRALFMDREHQAAVAAPRSSAATAGRSEIGGSGPFYCSYRLLALSARLRAVPMM